MGCDRTIEEHLVFRALLQAMARPGTVHSMTESVDCRDDALELLARALLDSEASIGVLVGADGEDDLARRMADASGCRFSDPGQADFALVAGGSSEGRIGLLRAGDPDFPDESATLVYLVDEVDEDGGAIAWEGPGIFGYRLPRVTGIADDEWIALRKANAAYPVGFDALFVDRAGRVLALPRSVRMRGVR